MSGCLVITCRGGKTSWTCATRCTAFRGVRAGSPATSQASHAAQRRRDRSEGNARRDRGLGGGSQEEIEIFALAFQQPTDARRPRRSSCVASSMDFDRGLFYFLSASAGGGMNSTPVGTNSLV